MIKRILLVLDPGLNSIHATNYAIQLAERHNACITGIAVAGHHPQKLATKGITGSNAFYLKELNDQKRESSLRQAGILLDRFERSAQIRGICHRADMQEGATADSIADSLKNHDLLIFGSRSSLQFYDSNHNARMINRIIKRALLPSLLVSRTIDSFNDIVIAFDGSEAVVRTLKWFVQLNLVDPVAKLTLLHIIPPGKNHGEARGMVDNIGQLLDEHGYHHINKIFETGGTPSQHLLKTVMQRNSDLVVMGAHSSSLLQRVAVGSTTNKMLKELTVPLFIGH